jgi:hypothetical protein
MKKYIEVRIQIYVFLTSSLIGDECLALRTGRFVPEKRAPVTHCIGGWVGPRNGLDDMEKGKFLFKLSGFLAH